MLALSGRIIMRGFKSFATVDEALKVIFKNLKPLDPSKDIEEVHITECSGRVLASDIIAPIDVPDFNRSAVDGYAVIAEDTFGASPTNPIRLKVKGSIDVGVNPRSLRKLKKGEAYEIFTGAPLPPGSDAVVMVEDAKRLNDEVEIYSQVPPWKNVSRKGEDFSKGDLVMSSGTRLKPWHIGALASLNISRIKVYRRVRIALLSTGDELREVGSEIRPGEVINSTKPMLISMFKDYGCKILDLGIVPDDINIISESIKRGLSQADIVVVTGGTSLGKKDLVPEAINSVAKPGLLVHGILIRPGRTAGIAFDNGKPIFLISGFPVAAVSCFLALIEPTLNMMTGTREEPKPIVKAKLTRRLATPAGLRSYVRVRVFKSPSGEYYAEPLRLTGSGILSTMTRGNGILIVEEGVEGYDEGEEVEVMLIQPIEVVGDG